MNIFKNFSFFVLLVLFSASDLSSQELSMYPGFWSMQFYQDDVRLTKPEFLAVLKKDPEAHQQWSKSNKQLTGAFVAIGAQIGFLVWQFNRRDNNQSQTLPLIGNLAAGTTAIVLAISSTNSRKKAILAYNRNLPNGTTINLIQSNDGIGLALNF